MNTTILRMLRRHDASTVSVHFSHGISYHRLHPFWKVQAVSWPVMVDGYKVTRSARLDWHGAVIKRELRDLLKRVVEAPETV